MRRCTFVMLLVILVVLVGGCAKKHSRTTMTPTPTPASPPPQPVAAQPVAAPPPAPAPAPAPDPLAGDLASVNQYLREQGLLADVLFDLDRDELRPDARRQLEAIAGFLKEHSQFEVALDGHADERGTVEYNLALGQKRAASARSYLDSMGVVRDRLQAMSYGEERPLCAEHDESCWQQNRRVHFEIVGRTELALSAATGEP
jgi:peptidoglycan-associated lipoprotein